MHTMGDNNSTGNTVPAFITKLWKLVEDSNYDHLIQWNQNGRSFIIQDQSKFAKELLPLYFKHSNMASFIRQLNMYGFRKVSNIENSGLRSERDDIEFYNQHFVRGKEFELEFIKRKVPLKQLSAQISTGKPGIPSPHFKNEEMTEILSDMESIKGKQDSVDGLLTNMQRENEALWREVAILRQKHHKQQQIVEKLIQFLVSLVQNRGIVGIKRKAQLMIDDTQENQQKMRNKLMKQNDYTQSFSPGNSRTNGPIIHDITDDIDETISGDSHNIKPNISEMSPKPQILLSDVSTAKSGVNVVTADPLNDEINETKPIESLNILDPLRESIKELGLVADPEEVASPPNDNSDVDQLLRTSLNTPPGSPSLLKSSPFETTNTNCDQNPNDVKDLVISTQSHPLLNPITSSLNTHVEGIEAELDWLQDQLSAGYNIDNATLLGLFSSDDSNQMNYPMTSNYNIPNNEIMGNEVVQFQPNTLFEDLDLDQIANDETRDHPLLEEEFIPDLDVIPDVTVNIPSPETGVKSGQT